jgi:predicted phage baseplate assembly protein
VSLQAPNLDDRRFQDIVDETKRLIPKYCREWTNHNLSDPGVALIELFAWMSEMLLYRLNQVPERFYTKFLELMGVAPYPPTPAHANLTFWLSTVLDQEVRVPAGTQVAATGLNDPPVIFSTVEDLSISPPQLVAARTGRGDSDPVLIDVWDDLRFDGSVVRCFASEPVPAPGDALYLGFTESLAGAVLQLGIRSTSPVGIGIYPTRPPVTWEVWSGEAWITAPVFSDTTGGLNRDGDVTLLVPLAHQPLALGGTRAYWVRVQLVRTSEGEARYQATPEIHSVNARILGGTVVAEHAVEHGLESLGRSNGLPGQEFLLKAPPVLPRRADELIRVVTDTDVQRWDEVEDFMASRPTDRHYVLDGGTGTVYFGPKIRYPDGSWRQHGAIPPPNAEILMTGYRHGGGREGNVDAGTLTVMRTTVAFVDRVSNVEPARGGADAEPVNEAKRRGPMTLRTGQRAVTPGDFERLALEASVEVARTRCLSPESPGQPVRLLVVPRVRREADSQSLDDYALTDGLIHRLQDYLDDRRLVGTTVELSTPYYQGVTVAARLRAVPTRGDDHLARIQADALERLYTYINPLTGGKDGTGWPWDADLNAAPIAQLLATVDGVDRVEEVLLFECDLRTGRRFGAGREVIRLDERSLFLSARQPVSVSSDDGRSGRPALPSHTVVVSR